MRTSKGANSARTHTQVEAYVRKLLGSNQQTSGWSGAINAQVSLPKGGNGSSTAGTPHALPRQLEATAYTKTSQTASGSSSFGNAWLISPIASTVRSILNLFGGGSATSQSTKYRTSSRQTFHIVESISPETGSGTRSINENAAGLTGVTGRSSAGGGATLNALSSAGTGTTLSQFEDRQALVAALRRSLSESRGISDVLNEFQDGL